MDLNSRLITIIILIIVIAIVIYSIGLLLISVEISDQVEIKNLTSNFLQNLFDKLLVSKWYI